MIDAWVNDLERMAESAGQMAAGVAECREIRGHSRQALAKRLRELRKMAREIGAKLGGSAILAPPEPALDAEPDDEASDPVADLQLYASDDPGFAVATVGQVAELEGLIATEVARAVRDGQPVNGLRYLTKEQAKRFLAASVDDSNPVHMESESPSKAC